MVLIIERATFEDNFIIWTYNSKYYKVDILEYGIKPNITIKELNEKVKKYNCKKLVYKI